MVAELFKSKTLLNAFWAFVLIYLSAYFVFISGILAAMPGGLNRALGALISVSVGTIYLLSKYPINVSILIENMEQYKKFISWGLLGGVALGFLNFPYGLSVSSRVVSVEYEQIFGQKALAITMTLLVFVIVVPFLEELLFRLLIYGKFRDEFGAFWGYSVSSLLFFFGHGFSLIALFSSLVLCYIYEKSKLIGSSIFAHIMWNSVWYVAIYMKY